MKKSIARVGIALIENPGTETEAIGEYTWLESEKAGGREYSAEPQGESTEVYADGRSVFSLNENNGYNITLTLLAIIDKIAIDILGRKKTKEGIAEYADGKEAPRFALALAEDDTEGNRVISQYPNCQISGRPSKNGKTSEGSFDPQFPQFAIAARPRAKDKLVCHEITKKQTEELPTEFVEPTEPEAV